MSSPGPVAAAVGEPFNAEWIVRFALDQGSCVKRRPPLGRRSSLDPALTNRFLHDFIALLAQTSSMPMCSAIRGKYVRRA
jgi:hypothetical protein